MQAYIWFPLSLLDHLLPWILPYVSDLLPASLSLNSHNTDHQDEFLLGYLCLSFSVTSFPTSSTPLLIVPFADPFFQSLTVMFPLLPAHLLGEHVQVKIIENYCCVSTSRFFALFSSLFSVLSPFGILPCGGSYLELRFWNLNELSSFPLVNLFSHFCRGTLPFLTSHQEFPTLELLLTFPL